MTTVQIYMTFICNVLTFVTIMVQTIRVRSRASVNKNIFTGLPYGNPSRILGRFPFSFFLVFFFFVSVKVLPVTPLVTVTGVFVHRAF